MKRLLFGLATRTEERRWKWVVFSELLPRRSCVKVEQKRTRNQIFPFPTPELSWSNGSDQLDYSHDFLLNDGMLVEMNEVLSSIGLTFVFRPFTFVDKDFAIDFQSFEKIFQKFLLFVFFQSIERFDQKTNVEAKDEFCRSNMSSVLKTYRLSWSSALLKLAQFNTGVVLPKFFKPSSNCLYWSVDSVKTISCWGLVIKFV